MTRRLPPSGRTIRAVGFDDAPFTRGRRGPVGVAGVVCAGTRFEGLVWGRVRQDGWDATEVLIRLLAGGKFLPQLHLVLHPTMSLGRAHVISDSVETSIREAFPQAEVIVHVDPWDDDPTPPAA